MQVCTGITQQTFRKRRVYTVYGWHISTRKDPQYYQSLQKCKLKPQNETTTWLSHGLKKEGGQRRKKIKGKRENNRNRLTVRGTNEDTEQMELIHGLWETYTTQSNSLAISYKVKYTLTI